MHHGTRLQNIGPFTYYAHATYTCDPPESRLPKSSVLSSILLPITHMPLTPLILPSLGCLRAVCWAAVNLNSRSWCGRSTWWCTARRPSGSETNSSSRPGWKWGTKNISYRSLRWMLNTLRCVLFVGSYLQIKHGLRWMAFTFSQGWEWRSRRTAQPQFSGPQLCRYVRYLNTISNH